MIDFAKIKIKAGNGGDGLVSFKHLPKNYHGGPDGGNGGKGGDVILVVNENKTTLMDFKSRGEFKAQDGERGGKNNKTGAGGDNLYLEVPVGTQVKEILKNKEERILADLTKNQETYLIAFGGEGGKGNESFKSSTNQAPLQATKGVQGEEREVVLEMKLIADVGIIGLPNAGKSTLLNTLTRATAKVGNYPFTTIEPNLGVLYDKKRDKTLVLADLPGLIEGASTGKGLGGLFLRHVERTKVLIHLIDPTFNDAIESYKAVRKELYSKQNLPEKKELVVISKVDITEVRDKEKEITKAFKKLKIEPLFISAATGENIENLKNTLFGEVEKGSFKVPVKENTFSMKRYTLTNLPNKRVVFKGKVLLDDDN